MTNRRREGATLIELIITIAMLGILSAVATTALLKPVKVDPNDPAVIAQQLRSDAVRFGIAKTAVTSVNGNAIELTAYPDGSVVADSALAVNPLTGRTPNATR